MQLLFLYFRNQTNKWIQLQTHSFIGLYHRFSSCKINKHQGDNITQRLDLALIWRQFILTFERLKNKQDPPSIRYLPRENNSRQAWSHFIKRVDVQIMKCWKATNLSSSKCRKNKKKKPKHNIIYQKNCNDINNNDQPTKTHYVYINAGIVN